MSYKEDALKYVYEAYKYKNKDKYKLALLEKAVNIAGQHDDVLFEMYCRFDLIDAYVFSGEIIKAFMHFTWCQAQRKKGYTDDKVIYNSIWHHKYISSEITEFTSISCEKINNVYENMKKIFIENNVSLKSYYSLRIEAYMSGIDNGTDIQEYYKKFLLEPEDEEYDDCRACTLDAIVRYYIFLGKYEKALKEAKNIINGTLKCAQIPHVTFAKLLLPLYELKKYELAETLQRKGIRLINGDKVFVTEIGFHMMYLALTNPEKGIKVFEKNYSNFLKANMDSSKMWFNVGAYALFSKLQENEVEIVKIKVPTSSKIYSEDGYNVSELSEFFRNESMSIMDAFDKRNNNSIVSDDVKRYLKICIGKE
ncbi:hypothetical protein ACFIJ5_10955 [Haloimpatiens sp. FM7330]|uniref:hypothetical protein n=1 Tax=Haloimpatiens sp. FM7330 TaxID=3298610 RepID=UPI003634DA27